MDGGHRLPAKGREHLLHGLERALLIACKDQAIPWEDKGLDGIVLSREG